MTNRLNNKKKLVIGWLYPRLMSTYGDRGNVLVLKRRCEWRDIEVEVIELDNKSSLSDFEKLDLVFGGGAQDHEQEIVIRDLKGEKGNMLQAKIEKEVPGLFVCGSYQLLGRIYEPAEGELIEGLGIFDIETKHPGINEKRLIGNVLAKIENDKFYFKSSKKAVLDEHTDVISKDLIIGFENHGGRTYLGRNIKPLAKIVVGFGNNGKDGSEGAVYKNAIGTYLHGPLLPKNPYLADSLIQKALEVKYKESIELPSLNDMLEEKTRLNIVKKIRT